MIYEAAKTLSVTVSIDAIRALSRKAAVLLSSVHPVPGVARAMSQQATV